MIEPPKPIVKFIYLCDRAFHPEYILPLYENDITYGVIIVRGEDALFYQISGTEIRKLDKQSTRISKNQKKGGQSAPRIGRIRDEEIQQYLAHLEEKSRECFLENDLPQIKCLIVAGPGEKKNKLAAVLHPKLREMSHVITITEKDDITTMKGTMDEIVKQNGCQEEIKELQVFLEMMEVMDERAVYGKKIVEKAFRRKMLAKLLIHQDVWKKIGQERVQMVAEESGCQIVVVPGINEDAKRFLETYEGIVGIRWY